MTYTKGEWRAYRDSLTKDACSIDIKHTGHEQTYTEIAMVYHSRDAHLIAAAPDMYEALKSAVALLEHEGYQDNQPVLKPMIETLAKAEGKQAMGTVSHA